uniref:Nucleolar protein 10 n=1 Tax=Denticeps clupeoides TaxID=299321 RepID=A0AAY4DQX3_9TELE
MQVSNVNNVKIYNLSYGKSLPQWLSDRKKRALQKKDVDVQRRIELIQDFEMPTVCTSIKVSRDGQYVLAAGTYKPRIRCYDTYQLSLKFERCLDSDVVAFDILSEDYSKLVFLHTDRYVEFHSQHGHYYKTRIPKFGRDFSYHYPSCDLYFVGASSEIFRLNLEQGRFLNSLQTSATEHNVCDINPVHQLFAAGTIEGKVECWDPRVRNRVALLDCALSSVTENTDALKFSGALNMAVGTSTGQVLLYDLRSSHPLLVKDHYYGLPIKSLNFHDQLNLVLSADSKIIKMWHRDTGKIFCSVEPQTNINDVCVYPNSGMLFTANEDPKMNTLYIPALGPAPRWCCFLDNLTEELEENPESTIYDDYKFVTRKDLENLGILLQTFLTDSLQVACAEAVLFISIFHVKTMTNPFAYEEYRKDKIRQKIEESRAQRVQLKKLPKVNKELAIKLMEDGEHEAQIGSKKKGKATTNILSDNRFKMMFENPDYQVDEQSEEYRLLNPIVSKVSQKRRKKLQQLVQMEAEEQEEEELEGRASSDEESSDDDKSWVEEVREQRRLLRLEERNRKMKERERKLLDRNTDLQKDPRFYQIKAGEEFRSFGDMARKQKLQKASLEERLKLEERSGIMNLNDTAVGSKQLTFTLKKVRQNLHLSFLKLISSPSSDVSTDVRQRPITSS